MKALLKEIQLQKNFLNNEKIATIYFGGGTPSLLAVDDCRFILNEIAKAHKIDPDAEITLEANPDDITQDKINGWNDIGFNRLSLGVQSFFEEDLKWMNRAHNSKQAMDSLLVAQSKFDNISIDLIYGTPLLTDAMWKENVDRAVSLGIPHLSCYALTVEERTPLHKQIFSKAKEDVDQEKQARQFLHLMNWLSEKGYEHYEVSNFAKPGCRSRHNSSYWQGDKYLGLGPSAHSFNGTTRQWNVANNNRYIRSIESGILEKETEELTEIQQLNEYIMISLRTMEGLDLNYIEEEWGETKKQGIEKGLPRFQKSNWVKVNNSKVRLTEEGMLRADGIAADLFF